MLTSYLAIALAKVTIYTFDLAIADVECSVMKSWHLKFHCQTKLIVNLFQKY